MEPAALLLFGGTLLIAAASPGPGVAALVARAIGTGFEGAAAFAAGLIVGDLVWLAVAVLGLAVVAQTFQAVLLVLKYAGAAYLLYLAWRMWTTPVVAHDIAIASERGSRGDLRMLAAGLALTLGNPKVVAFYLALLPNLIDLDHVGLVGYLELALVSIVVLTGVFAAYVTAAVRARRLFRSPCALRLLNRTGGTLIAGAAVAVAAK
ncbi:MAG: LysE family translocator [Hyphomicrobiales bacterium]|nr:LysE family translocator [Hyphomicrobiales bacterium]